MAGGIPLLKLPVTREEPACEQKRKEPDVESDSDDDEEDDLGVSPPSIVLVEGPPSSAQRPKNPDKPAMKKTRKESEEQEQEFIPPMAETCQRMSFDKRIEYIEYRFATSGSRSTAVKNP